jgi:hypothetical protein
MIISLLISLDSIIKGVKLCNSCPSENLRRNCVEICEIEPILKCTRAPRQSTDSKKEGYL